MIRFYSPLFPNLTVSIYHYSIKFNKGIYDTDNPKEIEALKNLGFGYDVITSDDEGTNAEEHIVASVNDVKHTIPSRWSKEKIMEYVRENNIELPNDEMTKAELVEYIESL